MPCSLSRLVLAAGALLASAACADRDPVAAGSGATTGPRFSISVASPDVAMLSAEVTARDLRDTLRYDLDLDGGRSAASLAIPAGTGRRLVVRAHDRYGRATHAATLLLERVGVGENAPLDLALQPVETGDPIRASVGLVGEAPRAATISVRASASTLLEGGSITLRASVVDATGRSIELRPGELHWAVDDPRLAHAQPPTVGTELSTTIYGWGSGRVRVQVVYSGETVFLPVEIAPDPYVAVTAGDYHTCALRQGGAAFCWGRQTMGQLGSTAAIWFCPGTTCRPRPTAVAGTQKYQSISATGNQSCAVTKTGGAIYCWGANDSGQLGNGQSGPGSYSSVPVQVQAPSGVSFTAVAVGGAHACALSSASRAYCWGSNSTGQLGTGSFTTPFSSTPQPVFGFGIGHSFIRIQTGKHHSCAIEEVVFPDPAAARRVAGDLRVSASGDGSMLSAAGDHETWCWGNDGAGQLGDWATGGGSPQASPVQVSQGGGFWAMSTLSNALGSCGLTATRAAYCWGGNHYGELGTGTGTLVQTPTALPGGLTFLSLSVGAEHGCGVSAANDIYCWGDNYGDVPALGGFMNKTFTPSTMIIGGHKFSSVAVGYYHACGVELNGQIYCWGESASGQLGDGASTATGSGVRPPMQVVAP